MPAVPKSQWGGWQKKGRIDGEREAKAMGREKDTQHEPTRLFTQDARSTRRSRNDWLSPREERLVGRSSKSRLVYNGTYRPPVIFRGAAMPRRYTRALSSLLSLGGERAPGTNHKTWGLKRSGELRGERKRERERESGRTMRGSNGKSFWAANIRKDLSLS